jgi:hypothetical protein
MNIGLWKNPGGKKILWLSGLILRRNHFFLCAMTSLVMTRKKERKKSLTRGHVEDIGSTVGIPSYKRRGRRSGVPGCVSTSSRTGKFYVMAVLSGARVVRVLCVCVSASSWVVARWCAGDASECARCRLTPPGSASTKRFMFRIMPMRRCDDTHYR